MAPPTVAALLPEKVLLVTVTVPPLLMMAPPPGENRPLLPLAIVRFWTVNVTPEFTTNTPTVPPPLMVITLPPSMVVSALMVFVLVTVIVAAPPQAKVTLPSKLAPPARQASNPFNPASVQLALVPAPTMHAKADEVAAITTKTSSAGASTNRMRTVVVFIACLQNRVRCCGAASLLVEARPLAPWDRRIPARALAPTASVRVGALS